MEDPRWVADLLLALIREVRIRTIRECIATPLQCEPDHPDDYGYAAHLRTELARKLIDA